MIGKVNFYTQAMSFNNYKKYETKKFMSSIHNDDIKSFMDSLVDNNAITREDLSSIKDWFNEKAGDK